MDYNYANYEEMQKDILNRLKRIEGQVRGVQKMIDENRTCGEVVIQLAAIKAAINSTGFTVLACHIANCMKESMGNGKDPGEALSEFISILKKFS